MLSDEKFLGKLGRKIESLASEKFSTQTEFSDASGIDTRTIRRIIKAEQNPTVLVLRNIARALQISLSELIDIDE